MIALDRVRKAYATPAGRKVVLDNATLTFSSGHNFGILGANGAGKSTLIRLLAGSEMPDRGIICRYARVSFPLGFGGTFHGALSRYSGANGTKEKTESRYAGRRGYVFGMEGYWTQAICRAWHAAIGSLGFNQKTVATALLAIGGFIVVALKAGVPSARGEVVTALWYAAPPLFAGMVLFAVNFISEQAKMYKEVAEKLTAFGAPDYSAAKTRKEFRIYEAAYLWCELAPSVGATHVPQARQWIHALLEAAHREEIKIVEKDWYYYPSGRRRPSIDQSYFVSKESLKAYACRIGSIPKFLQD